MGLSNNQQDNEKRKFQEDSSGDVAVNVIGDTGSTMPFNADYVATTFPTDTQEIYTYKTGGSGGTTVGTMTINYVDSCKLKILNATKANV